MDGEHPFGVGTRPVMQPQLESTMMRRRVRNGGVLQMILDP
jgi:hypothetical protein